MSRQPRPAVCLAISKASNGADNLHIIAAALSDGEREGHLVLAASSELNSLDGTGPGETVQITSLDAEQKIHNWGAIDFSRSMPKAKSSEFWRARPPSSPAARRS